MVNYIDTRKIYIELEQISKIFYPCGPQTCAGGGWKGDGLE
jgi:hypothetical protein